MSNEDFWNMYEDDINEHHSYYIQQLNDLLTSSIDIGYCEEDDIMSNFCLSVNAVGIN